MRGVPGGVISGSISFDSLGAKASAVRSPLVTVEMSRRDPSRDTIRLLTKR